MSPLPPIHEMERASRDRDPAYDGVFWLAVRTTGIFCRPTCPARKPLPGNVEYLGTVREALFAGYRPCKRCRPLEAAGTPPEWVARLLAAAELAEGGRLRDAQIRALGIEPARARRHFQREYGLTFQAYCRSRRLGEAFDGLRRGAGLDDSGYEAGFESASGFRAAFARLFGAPPGSVAKGSKGSTGSIGATQVRIDWIESPLGPLVAGSDGTGICLLEFTDRRALEAQLAILQRRLGAVLVPGRDALLERLREELADYFAGARREFTVPLVEPGTPFERRVWEALLAIPYGETRSYAALARAIGSPGAARAVGAANGRNLIAIVVPCHRVVNADGELGGYGGGLWRKRWLLDLERGRMATASAGPEIDEPARAGIA